VSQGTEFVRDWLGAYNRGDVEALVGICHADVDLFHPDGRFQGPEGVRANFNPAIEATSERSILELRDGKLAASRGQFDRMTLAAHLGHLPDPAAGRR
jgi:ketosteroid isomerase-like protein